MRRLALALSLLATPALAQSPRAAMFPSDASCYLRHYDKAHLAKHPAQRVREIAIGPMTGNFESDVLILKVMVWIDGHDGYYTGVASCENTGGSLSCQLEGDAGWFTLTPRRQGAILMKLGRDGIGFEGRDFVTLSGSSGDDREFLLPPVAADSCP